MDDRCVVDNDGLHGRKSREGSAYLSAGLHALRVEFFTLAGYGELEIRFERAGNSMELLPPELLVTPFPFRPKLVFPSEGAYCVNPLDLQWQTTDAVINFIVELSGVATFDSIFVRVEGDSSHYLTMLSSADWAPYYWRVRAENNYGPGAWSEVRSFTVTESFPVSDLTLLQNYPNPSRMETIIPYRIVLQKAAMIVISAADGKEVRRLSLGLVPQGYCVWDGRNEAGALASPGVYLYSLECGGKRVSRSFLVVR